MRKINAIISHVILILFLIHGVLGAFNLAGIGAVNISIITVIMLTGVCLHIAIGCILTIKTMFIQKKAGVSYLKENRLFWIRRISGFAVMIFIVFHVLTFAGVSEEHYRLPNFDTLKLFAQIGMILTLACHILTNIKPLMISTGTKKIKVRVVDLIFWISVLLAVMAVGFMIYYIRWNRI